MALKDAVVHGYATGYDYSNPSSSNWLSYVNFVARLVGGSTPVSTYIDSSRIVTSQTPYQPVFPEKLPTTGPNLAELRDIPDPGTAGALVPTVYNAGSGITVPSGVTITIAGPVIIESYANSTISGGFVLTTNTSSRRSSRSTEASPLAAMGSRIQTRWARRVSRRFQKGSP